MSELFLPALFIWGLIAGFLGGLLGVGGGMVFVLVIPEAARRLGVQEVDLVSVTIANSLACTFFTSFAAGVKKFASDNLIRKGVLSIGIFSTIVSLVFLHFVVNSGLMSRTFFDVFFIVILLYLMLRIFFRIRKNKTAVEETLLLKPNGVLLAGFFSGVVSALSGLGGGIVIVPVLHTMLRFPIRVAQSISFGVIAFSTFFSTIFNLLEHPSQEFESLRVGLILIPVIVSIAPISMVGSLLGSWVSGRMNSKWSAILLFAFFLFTLVRKIIYMY